MTEFQNTARKDYITGFSYGILEVLKSENVPGIGEVLEAADAVMYEQKRMRKKEYEKELE